MLYLENTRFDPCDGYGNFATNLLKNLNYIGEEVYPVFTNQVKSNNTYVNKLTKFNWYNNPLLSCLPPSSLCKTRHLRYMYTMTEGSEIPNSWAEQINNCNIHKVFVPSEYCKQAFASKGIESTVIPGGTESKDFPIIKQSDVPNRPYTFLLLADRGMRKGWVEGWDAFWNEFSRISDVHLIIKYREDKNARALNMLKSQPTDKFHNKVTFIGEDYPNMHDLYKLIDCAVIPSHSEGWGMPHRECAISGIPTITLAYSGLYDGNINKWSYPVYHFKLVDVQEDDDLAGQCALPDVEELGTQMKWCYENQIHAKSWAVTYASSWLQDNQNWLQCVNKLRTEIYGT